MRILNHKKCFSFAKLSTVDDYEITGFLGQGSTSRVFQGFNILNQKQVIIKLFKNIDESKILREIRTNHLIRDCPNIIPLVDVVRDPGCSAYGLIFENLKGVTLNHLIGKIEPKQGIKYGIDIIRALECCHSKGVVHRDLKTSNILITGSGAKLFDFGLSRTQKIDDFKTKRFGTKCFYSPQVMFRIPTFNQKIDIWVLGVIITEMLTKTKPLMPYFSDEKTMKQIIHFSGYNQKIVKDQRLKGVKTANWDQLFSQCELQLQQKLMAINLVKSMLKIDPDERPSASQLLQQSKLLRKYMEN